MIKAGTTLFNPQVDLQLSNTGNRELFFFHPLSSFPLVAAIVGTNESPGRELVVSITRRHWLHSGVQSATAPSCYPDTHEVFSLNNEMTHPLSAAQQHKPNLPIAFCFIFTTKS